MTKAIGYARISPKPGDSELGLEAQHQTLREKAAEIGVALAEIHDDYKVSGTTALDEREGFMSALAALDDGDVLIVARRDRIGRDRLPLAMVDALIRRRGARLVVADAREVDSTDPVEQANAALMEMLTDAFAIYERMMISARTKLALRAKKARGEAVGALPFGVRMEGGVRVRDEAAQKTIDRIIRLREAGNSYRAIAAVLDAEGRRTARGARWTHKQVAAIIRRHEAEAGVVA